MGLPLNTKSKSKNHNARTLRLGRSFTIESVRSAPVLGRRDVGSGEALETSNDSGANHVSAPEDGRTPEKLRGLTKFSGIVIRNSADSGERQAAAIR
jgi:hypothetical protein